MEKKIKYNNLSWPIKFAFIISWIYGIMFIISFCVGVLFGSGA